ncbi:MAG: hypothetical protein Q7R79_00870 [bacterium]|nr:hypothetical protein [bacterium]
MGILLCILEVSLLSGLEKNTLIQLIAVAYLLLCGWMIAYRLFHKPLESILLTPLCASVPLIISGTAAYLLYKIDTAAIALCLLSPFIAAIVAHRYQVAAPPDTTVSDEMPSRAGLYTIAFFFLFAISLIASFSILFKYATTHAVLGPWQVIPPQFFVAFFCAGTSLFLLLRTATLSVKIIGIAAYSFLAYSITLLLFPIGFGFDPFLHQATERLILEHGFVEPKTFYYIGHYALVTILSRVLSLGPANIDALVVPFLTAITLPVLAYRAIGNGLGYDARLACVGALLGVALPFGYATTTTPWTLAYTIIIFLILSSLFVSIQHVWKASILLALVAATLSIHPLAGLPALGFIILFLHRTLRDMYPFLKKTFVGIQTLISVLFSISLLGAFFVNSLVSNQLAITFKMPSLHGFLDFLKFGTPAFETRYIATLDVAYFFEKNGAFILLSLASIGVALFFKKKVLSRYIPYLQGWLITLLNAFFLKETIEFTSLIAYERSEYAERLIALSFLFLIPFIGKSLMEGIRYTLFNAREPLIRFAFSLFFVGLLPISLYLSYPRNDAYSSFHGFNVSKADIETVQRINKDAGDEQFIVLSNQVVAAAAVREFGFKKYFDTIINGSEQSLFYYPIPTSSPLAQYYVEMRQRPSIEIIQKAMDLIGVQRAYFVVHSYDERFPHIVSATKLQATSSFEINNGENVVFQYSR